MLVNFLSSFLSFPLLLPLSPLPLLPFTPHLSFPLSLSPVESIKLLSPLKHEMCSSNHASSLPDYTASKVNFVSGTGQVPGLCTLKETCLLIWQSRPVAESPGHWRKGILFEFLCNSSLHPPSILFWHCSCSCHFACRTKGRTTLLADLESIRLAWLLPTWVPGMRIFFKKWTDWPATI